MGRKKRDVTDMSQTNDVHYRLLNKRMFIIKDATAPEIGKKYSLL